MTRTWLVTWTTYGTWLPRDPRGFVSLVRTPEGARVLRNQYGTPYEQGRPRLQAYARSVMRQEPVRLTAGEARQAADQFRETARFRGWRLAALAVMANHVHLVVEVPEATPASRLLTDFKAYATRRLDRALGVKQIWWTERGSTRLLTSEAAVTDAVAYVRNQQAPLVVWYEGRENNEQA